MKLMLIDDDSFLRDMYATKFTEAGDEVVVASSGDEAIKLAKENEFAVVLMDMVMPGLHGPELIKQLKQSNKQTKPAVVVLSNQGEAEEIDSAKQAGAAGYLVKAEFIPSEVVAQVHEIISK